MQFLCQKHSHCLRSKPIETNSKWPNYCDHVHVNIKVHFQALIDKIYDSVIILTKKLTYI